MKNDSGISRDQMDLIERFIAAHNRIERCLRQKFDEDNTTPYGQLARRFAKQKPKIPDVENLQLLMDLRNSIVHDKTEPYGYLSVPLPGVVERIEHLRDYLLRPPLILDKTSGEVERVDETAPLTHVLALIEDKFFSQFPVYREGHFSGLLTENGIARWLARHVRSEMSLIDIADISVKVALRAEEKRHNCEFMPRTATVDEVILKFSENPELEAILITHSGNKDEKPLRIVTPWDVTRLRTAIYKEAE